MFSPGYAWNELRRRFGRTLVTAIGLAAAAGLVMAIIGVSDGLSAAQNRVLSPLGSVGTDIIVTRTIAPTTTQKSASTSTRTGAGSFFSNRFGGGGGPTSLNAQASSDSTSYDSNNGDRPHRPRQARQARDEVHPRLLLPQHPDPFPTQAVLDHRVDRRTSPHRSARCR